MSAQSSVVKKASAAAAQELLLDFSEVVEVVFHGVLSEWEAWSEFS